VDRSKRAFSLDEFENNVVVRRVVPPSAESSTAFVKRKRHEAISQSDESDLSQPTLRQPPTRAEREKDPTFRPNASANRNAKKTRRLTTNSETTDEEGEEISQASNNTPRHLPSIFERNIIENELITEDMDAPYIKPEPGIIQMPTASSQNQSMQFTQRTLSAYKDSIFDQLKANHRSLLLKLAEDMKDQKLRDSIKSLTDEDLTNFDVNDFWEAYRARQAQDITVSCEKFRGLLAGFSNLTGCEDQRELRDEELAELNVVGCLEEMEKAQKAKIIGHLKLKRSVYKDKARVYLKEKGFSSMEIENLVANVFDK